MPSLGDLLAQVTDPSPVPLDPLASRLVPAETGAIGMGFADGFLHVAWPRTPSPADIAELAAMVGLAVKPVALSQAEFAALAARLEAPADGATLLDAPSILDLALSLGASDIHLSAGMAPYLRVAGELRKVGDAPLTAGEVARVAQWLVGDAPVSEGFSGDLDRASEYRGWRLRVNVYRQAGQLALAARLIPGSPPPFSSLGLSEAIERFAYLPRGLVLFAGPTGSGKSTTQAALLDIVNRTSSRHIVTIEDPIEYVHPQRRCVVHQREVGEDTKSFAVALRAVLRQDPDVILVGEMRDPETITTTLTAAETGHLVLATVHAGSASEAVDRIVDAFPAEAKALVRTQLASCLVGIVCQVLLPSATHPGQRQAVAEVLVAHDAVRAHIRSGEVHQLRNDFRKEELGSMSLDQALADAVARGVVLEADAAAVARDPEAFREFLKVVSL
jgi:twitching motility protein PilT